MPNSLDYFPVDALIVGHRSCIFGSLGYLIGASPFMELALLLWFIVSKHTARIVVDLVEECDFGESWVFPWENGM